MLVNQIIELFTVVGLGLTLMLPLANPLTSMTLLLSLGSHIPWQERNRQIKQTAVYVVLVKLVTSFAGQWVMRSFGISIPGLRIAGGLRSEERRVGQGWVSTFRSRGGTIH